MACNRMITSIADSGTRFSSFSMINSAFVENIPLLRGYSVNSNRLLSGDRSLFKTSPTKFSDATRRAMVREFEAQGYPSDRAEAITSILISTFNDDFENLPSTFVSKDELKKNRTSHDVNMSNFILSKFMSDLRYTQECELKYQLQQEHRELQNNIDMLRSGSRSTHLEKIAEMADRVDELSKAVSEMKSNFELIKKCGILVLVCICPPLLYLGFLHPLQKYA